MINPTNLDINRSVIYKTWNNQTTEEGVITSFNHFYIFVRYGSDKQSKATKRENLQWVRGEDNNVSKSI